MNLVPTIKLVAIGGAITFAMTIMAKYNARKFEMMQKAKSEN